MRTGVTLLLRKEKDFYWLCFIETKFNDCTVFFSRACLPVGRVLDFKNGFDLLFSIYSSEKK